MEPEELAKLETMSLDLAAGSTTFTISDDQLPIMPESELTNGLELGIPNKQEEKKPTSPITVKPLDLEKIHAPKAGGRFRVQPTNVSDTMTYNNPITMENRIYAVSSVNGNDSTVQYSFPGTQSTLQTVTTVTGSQPVGNTTTVTTTSTSIQSPVVTIQPLECAKKKVNFPEGQALIKGFAHAPNPWYNGKAKRALSKLPVPQIGLLLLFMNDICSSFHSVMF